MAFRAIAALALAFQSASTPDLVAETGALVEQLLAGNTAPVLARFDEKMAAAVPESKLVGTLDLVRSQAGAFRTITGTRSSARDGVRVVVVTCDLERGALEIAVAYDARSRIVALNMRPPTVVTEYRLPSYVTPERYTESVLTVDSGTGWPLPGTLTMPVGSGPFPAVVLVHGSGPNDRDETIGPNRPFRDLALGLASRGVAVLRYDKRTLVHRAGIARLTDFTVKDETIDDALAATAVLRKTPRVRADRVFVAGHSLGGMLAPRIGAADPALAGLIVLAGAVRPLEDSILAQTLYLAEVDGTVSDSERRLIADAEALAAKLRALKPGDPPFNSALASGPASYVLDLRGYHPPTAAKALRLPMLVLQGERDYQVTMADFAAWRQALGDRPDVRFVSYSALDHLFIAGTGPSTPAAYQVEGHVDDAVIRDIAAWVAAR